ncbi:hypothetical protein K438DRAFT_178568 [Mycena galopus ATCC 62051]|nr:hypothetical protein K438DRAFT_178568 [Mycena galopus ATCC 62051]
MHGPVLGAGVLPPVSGKEKGEGVELGILTPHALYVYNLGTGHVSARAAFPPPTTGKERERERGYGERDVEGELGEGRMGTPGAFEATERVVVVTTHSPPALVVLARPCLRILHVFPAAVLAVPHPPSISDAGAGIRTSTSTPFPPYASSPSSASIRTPTLSPTSPTSPPASHTPRALPAPTPISAVHGRLLAFLAPAPSNSPTIGLLSGISSMSGAGAGAGAAAVTWGRTLGRFFSRSAPAASALLLGGSPPSGAGSLAGGGSVGGAVGSIMGVGNGGAGGGGGVGAWVRVVDLGPLLGVGSSTKAGRGREAAAPRDVHVFEAGRAPLGGLFFASDGTRLFAVRRDGLGAGVWALRPSPLPLSLRPPHLANPNASANDSTLPAPRHVYALRRGRTGAVVEAVSGARDGRFVALATRRRTVHVFAVNPYGGRADVRSHLRARVSDAEGAGAGVAATAGVGEAEAEGPTEVNALVRIRLPHQQQQLAEGEPARPPPAPLAIVFVPASGAGSSSASALRSPTSPASPTASGVQDVLVFDPADGVLSLRRITLSALDAPHNGISVSLPAAVGRLSMSASPPASYVRGGAVAAARGGGEVPPTELGGREAVVATWSLRRKRGWAEIRRAEGGEAAAVTKQGKEDWLAQAELSTFTSAPHVLPRAIYLSHQFAFYTLGEDYHALIRRYQFAIGGAKIDVRREVEVSAFAFGPGADEAFVEGYGSSSSPRAIRRRSRAASSSFDEPLLASALAGTHYRDARPPPVLPMLPNGSPASSLTFRSSMPVRAVTGLGDNVAEGLGRLRREMRHQRQKQLVRSPSARKSVGRGDDVEASVPLEFDEEDEDFAAPGVGDEEEVFLRVHADREDDDALSTTSRNGGESVASISTPATSAHPLEDEQRMEQLDLDVDTTTEGEWAGWGAEDKQAVEEAERFDDISVVGFLDEEQAAMQAEAARRKGTTTATARTRTKKRRN